MNNKVAVLLSTFNGENWIPELLESLNMQTVELKLIVRDDGSTDQSLKLIKQTWSQEIEICNHIEGNIGPGKSFHHLLSHVKDEKWVAFCDQDDMWISDKLALATSKLKDPESTPSAFCSSVLTFPKGNQWPTRVYRPSRINAIFQNIAIGSTLVLTNAAKNLLLRFEYDGELLHDDWINIIMNNYGEVYFEQKPTIRYRLHALNHTGMPAIYKESKLNYVNRLKTYGKTKKLIENRIKFISAIRQELPVETGNFLTTLTAEDPKLIHKKKYLSHKFRQSPWEDALFKFLYLINFFKFRF